MFKLFPDDSVLIDKIEVYPVIPDVLRQSALQKTIGPFIGAGVSQLGGCPGWTEFANAAVTQRLQPFERHLRVE